MNYVSAVYFAVITIIVIDWFLRGRLEYRGQEARREEAIEVERRASIGLPRGRADSSTREHGRRNSFGGSSGKRASVIA